MSPDEPTTGSKGLDMFVDAIGDEIIYHSQLSRDMLAMLQELEWIDDRRGPNGIVDDSVECRRCMSCFEFEERVGGEVVRKHAPDCRLSALLKRAKGET